MYHANVGMFRPKRKNVRNRVRRDNDCMRSYGSGLVFNYKQLGLYK